MSTKVKSPTSAELEAVLGSADVLWSGIVRVVEDMVVPLNTEWKPSKTEFGRICLLQHKKRTLLYLTPEKEKVRVAIILGERAYGLSKRALPRGVAAAVYFLHGLPHATSEHDQIAGGPRTACIRRRGRPRMRC